MKEFPKTRLTSLKRIEDASIINGTTFIFQIRRNVGSIEIKGKNLSACIKAAKYHSNEWYFSTTRVP